MDDRLAHKAALGITAQIRDQADAEIFGRSDQRDWHGSKVLDFSNPAYEQQPSIGERATRAMERQAVALESIARSLERLADEYGAQPPRSEWSPQEEAEHQRRVAWLGL